MNLEPHPRAKLLYLETSALLAALLEGDQSALRALRGAARLATSALTFAEAARTLARRRASRDLTDEMAATLMRDLKVLERRCAVVAVSGPVLAQVGARFPVEPVRTLDAIHLVSAQMLGLPPDEVVLLTRDRRVRANAAALAFGLAD